MADFYAAPFMSPVPIAKPVSPISIPTASDIFQQQQENQRLGQQLDSALQRQQLSDEGAAERVRMAQAGESARQKSQLDQQQEQWRQGQITKISAAMQDDFASDPESASAKVPLYAGMLQGLGVKLTPEAHAATAAPTATQEEATPVPSATAPGTPAPASEEAPTPEEPHQPPPPVTAMPPQRPGEDFQQYLKRWAVTQGYSPQDRRFLAEETPEVTPVHDSALAAAEDAVGVRPPPSPGFAMTDEKTGLTWNFLPSELEAVRARRAQEYAAAAIGTAATEGNQKLGEEAFSGTPTTDEELKARTSLYESAANRLGSLQRQELRSKKGRGGGGVGGAAAGGEGVLDSKEMLRGETMGKNELGEGEVKKLDEEYRQSQKATSLLQGNPSSADVTAAIKLLVRASGDNRISDQDFAHTPGMQSIWDKAREIISKGGTANYSPEEIARLRGLAEKLQKSAHDYVQGKYDAAKDSLGHLTPAARVGKINVIKQEFAGTGFLKPEDFPDTAPKKESGGGADYLGSLGIH